MIRIAASWRRLWLGLICTLGVPGCSSAHLLAQVRTLSQKVEELSRLQKEATLKQEDMENRVFLLSDQMESQKVAQFVRGSVDLPVVTLSPHRARPGEVRGAAQEPVEFSGAARSEEPEHVRPLLRAQGEFAEAVAPPAPSPGLPSGPPRVGGTAGQRPIARRRPPPGAPAALLGPIPPSGDNLGVVPIPRLQAGAAERTAREAPAPRLGAEAPASAPILTKSVATERTAVPGEPILLYRIAYDHLRAGRMEEAERDMREFVRRFPRHDYADNAQYWLGETFYARKTYGEAASAFRAVVERWPAGNKAPDALLKLGYSLLLLGETQKGRGVLSQVVDHYPRTDAARLAERRLAELKESK